MHSNWYERKKEYQKENASRHRKEYRQIAKEYVWDYLSTHPCSQCGENDPHCLEFHHIGEKTTEVSRLIGRGATLDALRMEISKCIVLCSNCHRKLTAKEQGWFKR
jgi:hypothetical protein